jgi:uncharacterized protein with HEPN domain
MCFEPRDYLRHILVEADYLIKQSTGVTAEGWRTTLRCAFVPSLEIIGEAAKKVPNSFDTVSGRRMAGDGWNA